MDELEFALAEIGGTAFEKFAMDFLRHEGYDVHESGSQGADGGWDARIEIGAQKGIAHASKQKTWKRKLRQDAESVEELEREKETNYDLLVFITNQHVSGEQQLDMEAEIEKEYGWTLKIHQQTNILGELRQNAPELAKRHFDIELEKDRDHLEEIENLHRERLDMIQARRGDAEDLESGPVLVLHVIPAAISSKSNDIDDGFPSPLVLGNIRIHYPEKHGKKVYTPDRKESGYAILRNDGLYETAVNSIFKKGHEGDPWLWSGVHKNGTGLDGGVVVAVRNTLQKLRELGYGGTTLICISLLDAEGVKMTRPEQGRDPFARTLHFNNKKYSTEFASLDIDEREIIDKIEPLLSEIWREFGYADGTLNIKNDIWHGNGIAPTDEVHLEEGQK